MSTEPDNTPAADVPKLTLITTPVVHVNEWDRFVSEVYGRPYSLQQQDGCVGRGIRTLTVIAMEGDSEYQVINPLKTA